MSIVSDYTNGFPETRASLLVRIADARDTQSWDEFERLYRPIVYRLARRQGMQHADAEELGQEVMLAVAKAIARWSPQPERGKFRHWFLRIARNLSINLRTRGKYRTLSQGDSLAYDILANHAAPGGELSQLFEIEYRRAIFHIAARQVRSAVTENTWQAFWLSTVDEVPIAEVASRLSMTTGSVYIARNRVMARLRVEVRRIETAEDSSDAAREASS